MNKFYLGAWLLTAVLCVVTANLLAGCSGHTPPDTNGGDPVLSVDEDLVVAMVADDLGGMGQLLQQDAATFGECIAGVVLQGVADHTRNVGVPIKQAIEKGECYGQTLPTEIDPSACVGLPGTPTDVQGVHAAQEEVERALVFIVPSASSAAELAAILAYSNGDETACVLLTYISDLLGPAGQLTTSILAIIEKPGTIFYLPGASWDCTQCR